MYYICIIYVLYVFFLAFAGFSWVFCVRGDFCICFCWLLLAFLGFLVSAVIFVWRKACQWCGRPQSVVTTASLAVLRRKMQDAAKACQWYGLPRATSPTVSFTCLRCVFGPMELPSKACQWYGSCRRAMRSLLRDTEPTKREPCAVGFGKNITIFDSCEDYPGSKLYDKSQAEMN